MRRWDSGYQLWIERERQVIKAYGVNGGFYFLVNGTIASRSPGVERRIRLRAYLKVHGF